MFLVQQKLPFVSVASVSLYRTLEGSKSGEAADLNLRNVQHRLFLIETFCFLLILSSATRMPGQY